MPPSKDDFEQLIEQCSQIKFSGVEINFDALESCLEESVQNFIDERQEMFRGFEKLSAYNWLTKTNGVSFNRANKRLGIPTFGQKDIKELIAPVIDAQNKRVARGVIEYYWLPRTQPHFLDVVRKIQWEEQIIILIAECFMEYLYPQEVILPEHFRNDLAKAIKDLENVSHSQSELKKYQKYFSPVCVTMDVDRINDEINKLKILQKEKCFPVQRRNSQNVNRMFVVSVVSSYLRNPVLKEIIPNNKLLPFVMDLLTFDCIEDPMTEVNVRNAIDTELSRREGIDTLKKRCSRPIKRGRGLSEILGSEFE